MFHAGAIITRSRRRFSFGTDQKRHARITGSQRFSAVQTSHMNVSLDRPPFSKRRDPRETRKCVRPRVHTLAVEQKTHTRTAGSGGKTSTVRAYFLPSRIDPHGAFSRGRPCVRVLYARVYGFRYVESGQKLTAVRSINSSAQTLWPRFPRPG